MHGTDPGAKVKIAAVLAALIGCGAVAGTAQGGETWPEFRGPTADGHTDATGLPVQLGEDRGVKWKTPLPGKGWSSPVVWGGQVWMTTANEDGTQRRALCVDLDSGKLIRDVKVFQVAEPEHLHALNSYASPSPVIEAGRVYVHFGPAGTACLDTATGNTVWQRTDLPVDYQNGPGGSPILYNDLLILHVDGMDVQYVIALDKHTGKTVWKTDRTVDFGHLAIDKKKAYETPLIVKVGDHDELLSVGAQAVYGYDPMTGRELWRYRYKGYSNVFRPVVDGGIAVFSTCYDIPHLEAIRLGGTGDITATHQAWSYGKNAPNKPSPIVEGGLLYFVSDSGIVTCLEMASGKEIWKQRVGGQYSASPLLAEGRIYLFSQDGRVTVLATGRAFKVLAEGKFEDGFMASPAVVGRAMILRTKTHLYRIEP